MLYGYVVCGNTYLRVAVAHPHCNRINSADNGVRKLLVKELERNTLSRQALYVSYPCLWWSTATV